MKRYLETFRSGFLGRNQDMVANLKKREKVSNGHELVQSEPK